MKKKLIVSILILPFIATACGNKSKLLEEPSKEDNQEAKEETKDEKDEVSEKSEHINAIFYAVTNDGLHYDDYVIFKDDGTFFRQNNFCMGYRHTEGTYEITKYKGDDAIKYVVYDHEDVPIYVKYNGDSIEEYINEFSGDQYNSVIDVVLSCYGIKWQKGDESKKIYYDEFTLEDYY